MKTVTRLVLRPALRPSPAAFVLGWLLVILSAALIAGTLAELARLPSVIVQAGESTKEATALRQLRKF